MVIGGGSDVDPFHYGEADDVADVSSSPVLDRALGFGLGLARALFATGSRQQYDPDRDSMEQAVIRHALYEDLPVLGICRGAQLMNVVLGGSLHQDIGHFYTEETANLRSVLPGKTVRLGENSQLAAILDSDTCRVNALHNQSIKRLGDGVEISAVEPVGVIQAIERPAQRFFIGVQWHPEYMPQYAAQQNLFRALCDSVLR